MIYLVVMIVSACGIAVIITARGVLRSRNARRIVRSVRRGFSNAAERNAKWIPDTPVEKQKKSPRTCAIELQQVRTLLRQAEKAIAKQDVTAGERALIQALTIHPDAKDVKVQLARVYLESGREPKAEALYRELLQATDDPALHANLGLACYKQEKFVESCQAYQKALNLEPRNPERSYDLGRACVAAKRFEDAAPLLEKASTFLTKDIDLLHLLAQCYMQLTNHESAEDVYRRINRMDPRDENVKARIAEMASVA
jgi:tetratricopeptide (TPR) repeat protein